VEQWSAGVVEQWSAGVLELQKRDSAFSWSADRPNSATPELLILHFDHYLADRGT
jgi:hypothetical protein